MRELISKVKKNIFYSTPLLQFSLSDPIGFKIKEVNKLPSQRKSKNMAEDMDRRRNFR